MTLDELAKLQYQAWEKHVRASNGNQVKANRAGVKAIVLALRDEMAPKLLAGLSYSITDLRIEFNDILGDAGEKSDDTNVREYAKAIKAADPSPVCEWTHEHGPYWLRHCHELGPEIMHPNLDLDHERRVCGLCGLPIKFKEPT